MPVVMRGATQTASGVQMTAALDGVEGLGTMQWLTRPGGLEQLPAVVIDAPAGQSLRFRRVGVVDEELTVDLDLSFQATVRGVSVNEAEALKGVWPTAWPEEAAGVLSAASLRDSGFDPKTGLVRELDDAELGKIARGYSEKAGVANVKGVPPYRAAMAVAGKVLADLRISGDAIQHTRATVPSGSTAKPGGLPGGFAGFACRDALTVLRGGGGNQVEVAVALSAVYRHLGLPSRVMVGIEAQEQSGRRAGTPRVRAWVEFALFHPSQGLAWVPLEPGRGARKAGLEDGDGIVVLATNLWPPSIREAGEGLCWRGRGDVPIAAAGLWGFWTQPAASHARAQELAVTAVRPTVTRSSDGEAVAVPRRMK